MKTLGLALLGIAMAVPASAQTVASSAETRQAHYQIGVMERVLEGAVEHGVANLRDRLQAVFPDAPAQLLILDNPRVRGFRLDAYGVFFDVEVPSLNGTLTWSLRTLDQVAPPPAASGAAPVPASRVAPILPNSRRAAGTAQADSQVAAAALAPKPAQDDKLLLENPNEAYRMEVMQAIADAMIDYSGPLAVADGEWLTVAARGIQDRPRLGPPDNDAQTLMARVRGADLAAFRSRQISREELMKRVEKRVF